MPPSLSCRNAVIVCAVMRCSPLVEGFRATDVLVVLGKFGLQLQRIANHSGLIRLKQVKSILQSNRDQLPDPLPLQIELPQDHENIRGPKTFH